MTLALLDWSNLVVFNYIMRFFFQFRTLYSAAENFKKSYDIVNKAIVIDLSEYLCKSIFFLIRLVVI